ncbi:class I SAM-dependent methyltransferase [Polynucleobacter sp. IMCC30063]|uniref:class I SAM-dependent methyltransferase n=1 Tax=Polynucleobacter sp. IMCC30063 TaxID=2907298 RepID=UPI001F194095|nr:class I SAM-dependent methyltransferase [Polynucleobacter sp. IMCC30063]MCE7505293.1 class I SAM-dependent methyltransferase [Polynucleobacter sp. IMCC30063]
MNLVTPLHTSTNRNYLERMLDQKVHCMEVASKYGFDYWDGERRYGYGGYKYIPGRWAPVALGLIKSYDLKSGSKVLDLGCGKGYLIFEMLKIEPGLEIVGIDNSEYAIENSKEEIQSAILKRSLLQKLEFDDKHFDLVVSLATLHNFTIFDLENIFNEINRVGKNSYIMVESYRNFQELFNLECWALTCLSFFSNIEWIWLFNKFRYVGDYEFIYFE